ncbi:hypothetical protein FFA01_24410 [Frigoribacterium faeni]|nr:hypothetical protein GCM10025699_75380 [Microbacterium flavescens]GEK84132.1 hypothetical protein FFA01_24410 [Frigoribacterium faeni]
MGPLSLFAPQTLFLAMYLAVRALMTSGRPRPPGSRLATTVTIATILLLIAAVVSTLLGPGPRYLPGIADSLVAPLVLFALVMRDKDRSETWSQTVRNGLLGLAVFESFLALVQFGTGRVLFFETARQEFWWYTSNQFNRATGTLDSPLDLAMLLLVALPLAVMTRRSWVRITAMFILTAGIALTASRLAIGLSAAAWLFALLGTRLSIGKKASIAVAAVTSLIVLLQTDLAQTALDRLGGSVASSEVRGTAVSYMLQNVSDFIFLGYGYSRGGSLRDAGVLASSIENAALSFAYDFGALPTALWFLAMILLALVAWRVAERRGLALALAFGLVMAVGYSSLSTRSAATPIFWTLVTLAAVSIADSRRSTQEGPTPSAGQAEVGRSRSLVRR